MEKKNITKNKNLEFQAPDKPPTEIKPVTDGQNTDKQVAYEQLEKDLNEKILKITMRIKDHYPELSKYLEEMPVTVPSENDPEITLNQLKSYYESLNSFLQKYNVDSPKDEERKNHE
ncbi:MAG: hypothetical protein CVT99_05600 [Bacteroidetes bacterium HGW-Bacteroidetes-16]|jgi:hypothetical protein|nr:MAG: hypothetical protein CVT99_05600 [Bacteroidetes bacterium HGW-Bacteroidetes-16]